MPLELAIRDKAANRVIESLIKPLDPENGIFTSMYGDKRTCKSILQNVAGSESERYSLLAEKYGTFLGRYKIIGIVVHSSATCLVSLSLSLSLSLCLSLI